jgi:hypothetical protein
LNTWQSLFAPFEDLSLADKLEIMIRCCRLVRSDALPSLALKNLEVGENGVVSIRTDASPMNFSYAAPEMSDRSLLGSELDDDADAPRGYVGPAYVRPDPELSTEDARLRAAVFALGAMLWEIVAGRRLFVGRTDYESLMLACAAVVPEIRDIPPGLETVIRRALSRDPEIRYQSPEQFGDALAEYVNAHA